MANTSANQAFQNHTDFLQKLVKEAFATQLKTPQELKLLKYRHCEEQKQKNPPANVDLIKTYQRLVEQGKLPHDAAFVKLLRKRAVRTLSGIAPLAVLTKPYPCPAKCIFCPNEKNMPRSYLSNEPAAMRAVLNAFDPHRQTIARLQAFHHEGHSTDKIEFIVIGGTFSFLRHHYQTWFIKRCLDGLNGKNSRSLHEAQQKNETAAHRCIGLTLETRPDYCTPEEMRRFRALGCTRVEIGVQTVFNHINDLNKRGHHIEEVYEATTRLKDAGMKVCYHMMPGLYGSTKELDLQSIQELFQNPMLRPDLLKMYPCMVVPFTELEKLWKAGKYTPMNDDDLADLLLNIKRIIPPYVRINRLIREFSKESILAGTTVSNFRQVLQKKMAREGVTCQCIRCREIRDERFDAANVGLIERTYDASGGKEFFLSYEETKRTKLIAMLRLRFPSQYFTKKRHFIRALEGAAIVRELHTYGQEIPIHIQGGEAAQHIGFGKKLMQRAEDIARQAGWKKLAVIAGVGTRAYYRKLGYELDGTYMIKHC